MTTQRKQTPFAEGFMDVPPAHPPVTGMRVILNWIVETDRRFRCTQDRIDGMSDRF